MGLDMVEILLEIEKEFHVSLDDAAGLVTVGDMYYVLGQELGGGDRRGCPTAAAFYRIRRAMVSGLGLPRSEIRLPQRLDALLPRRRRRAAWETLANVTGLRLPELQRPPWMVRAVWGVAALVLLVPPAVFCGTVACAGGDLVDLPFVVAGILLVLLIPFTLVAYCGFVLSGWFAREFAPECQTVGALARAAVARNPSVFADAPPDTADPLWQTLVQIISKQLGIQPERLTPASEWVRDLGC